MLPPVCGVRAMWSERSHRRRGLGPPLGPLGRLPSSPCVSCDVADAQPVARRLAHTLSCRGGSVETTRVTKAVKSHTWQRASAHARARHTCETHSDKD